MLSLSLASAPVPAPASTPAPSWSVAPSISGVAQIGQMLTGHDGTISNGTISGRQWRRNGSAISGATASTYLLTSADLDALITYHATATGAGGTSSATSAAVGPVSEEDIIFALVSADQATHTLTFANAETASTQQWQQFDGATWSNVAGQTGTSFVMPDTGLAWRVVPDGDAARASMPYVRLANNTILNTDFSTDDAGVIPANADLLTRTFNGRQFTNGLATPSHAVVADGVLRIPTYSGSGQLLQLQLPAGLNKRYSFTVPAGGYPDNVNWWMLDPGPGAWWSDAAVRALYSSGGGKFQCNFPGGVADLSINDLWLAAGDTYAFEFSDDGTNLFMQFYKNGAAMLAGAGYDITAARGVLGSWLTTWTDDNRASVLDMTSTLLVEDSASAFSVTDPAFNAPTISSPAQFTATIAYQGGGAPSGFKWRLVDRDTGRELSAWVNVEAADTAIAIDLPESAYGVSNSGIQIVSDDSAATYETISAGAVPYYPIIYQLADQHIGRNLNFQSMYADAIWAYDMFNVARWTTLDSAGLPEAYADENGRPTGVPVPGKEGWGVLFSEGAPANYRRNQTWVIKGVGGAIVEAFIPNEEVVFTRVDADTIHLEYLDVPTTTALQIKFWTAPSSGFASLYSYKLGDDIVYYDEETGQVQWPLVLPQIKTDFGAGSGFNAIRTLRVTNGEHLAEYRADGSVIRSARVFQPDWIVNAAAEEGAKALHWNFPVNITDEAAEADLDAIAAAPGFASIEQVSITIANEGPWNAPAYPDQNGYMLEAAAERGWFPGFSPTEALALINDLNTFAYSDGEGGASKQAVTAGTFLAIRAGDGNPATFEDWRYLIVKALANNPIGTPINANALQGTSDDYWLYVSSNESSWEAMERFLSVRSLEVGALAKTKLGAKAKIARHVQFANSIATTIGYLELADDGGAEADGFDEMTFAPYAGITFNHGNVGSSQPFLAYYDDADLTTRFVPAIATVFEAEVDRVLDQMADQRSYLTTHCRSTRGMAKAWEYVLYEHGIHNLWDTASFPSPAQAIVAITAWHNSAAYRTIMKKYFKGILSMGLKAHYAFVDYNRVRSIYDGSTTYIEWGFLPMPDGSRGGPANNYLAYQDALAELGA